MSYKLLLFGNTVRVFVSSLFAPLLAIFAREIGGTLIDVGGIYSIFFLMMGILSIPAGKLADKFGRKILVMLGGLMDSLISLGYVFSSSILHVYILQSLSGISTSISQPAWLALLAESTGERKRGERLGYYWALVTISSGVASLLAGIIASFYGFRIIFILMFIGNLIFTLCIAKSKETSSSKKGDRRNILSIGRKQDKDLS